MKLFRYWFCSLVRGGGFCFFSINPPEPRSRAGGKEIMKLIAEKLLYSHALAPQDPASFYSFLSFLFKKDDERKLSLKNK
jgi:hypothetical protein